VEEKEATKCYDQMLIVEKYETVISYLYPIAQNLPRKHAVARDLFLETLLGQVNLFIVAGKSNQASRLYQADAGLAMLRFWLRFLGKLNRFIPSWRGHAQWADTTNLFKYLENRYGIAV